MQLVVKVQKCWYQNALKVPKVESTHCAEWPISLVFKCIKLTLCSHCYCELVDILDFNWPKCIGNALKWLMYLKHVIK